MLLVRLMNTVEDKKIGEQFKEAYFGTKEAVEEVISDEEIPVNCEPVSDEVINCEEPVGDIQTISSREVADMMEIQHKHLLEKIDKINETFNSRKIGSSKYWIQSSYNDREKTW